MYISSLFVVFNLKTYSSRALDKIKPYYFTCNRIRMSKSNENHNEGFSQFSFLHTIQCKASAGDFFATFI